MQKLAVSVIYLFLCQNSQRLKPSRRGLEKLLEDHPLIVGFEFRRKDLRDPIPIKKLQTLKGAKLEAVLRRGKYLILQTDKGSVLSHLGMTGSWRAGDDSESRTHDHLSIEFSNGLRLIYHDPRRFGILDWLDGEWDQHPRLKNLGPEPLGGKFLVQDFWALLKTRQSPIKIVVMDASVVVGVGNIYASEALFRAGIRPGRKSAKVSKEEAQRLVSAIREVLGEAILAGGSTISDYVQANGDRGNFQKAFFVYDRKGKECRNCGSPVKWQVHSGRSSYFCPKCQR